jgi:hypothetical protein
VSYLAYSQYDGEVDLDNEDIQFGDIRALTRGERSELGFNGSVRRDLVLRTIGLIRDPAEPIGGDDEGPIDDDPVGLDGDVDSGFVDQQIRRVRTSASPYFTYRLSEQTRARVSYLYYGLDYDDDLDTGLQDSDTHGVGLDLSRRMSDRDTARITLAASQFEADNQDDNTDSYRASVGWERRFSDTFRGSIDVGAQRSERDDDESTGFFMQLRGVRSTETGTFTGLYEHRLIPNGFGDLVETDRLVARYAVALSDRLAFGLDGQAYRTRDSLDVETGRDRDYLETGPELTWYFTETISAGLFYRYRWIDREAEGSGSSNAVGITLAYQPQRSILPGGRARPPGPRRY